ncbi:MAG: hypothetical protein HYX55_06480 [Chloroflexi bacterium]|nr:hypothetical protein [Chloroflexota bacterium]
MAGLLAGLGGLVPSVVAVTPTPIQVYGAWHCSNDYCTWGAARDTAAGHDFDLMNHWLIDRGDGKPSVNLVVLSFVQPLKLLNQTTDSTTINGVPRGMTPAVVQYFTSRGVRVMVSIGGITYTSAWNTALAQNATLLGQRAAALAMSLGVGVEIDYEESRSPNLTGLQAFITAYRAVLPYDATGGNPAARLTIDLAAGDRWLIGITQKATADWLRTTNPVLDYANAMVPSKQPSTSSAISNWQEHIDGKPQYAPPIPPLAPAKFTGSVYIAEGSQVRPECNNFAGSLQSSTGTFVQTVASKIAGTTNGMLGYMFWAAEKPSTRGVGTQPPNTCQGGVGVGSSTYGLTWPMGPLRES